MHYKINNMALPICLQVLLFVRNQFKRTLCIAKIIYIHQISTKQRICQIFRDVTCFSFHATHFRSTPEHWSKLIIFISAKIELYLVCLRFVVGDHAARSENNIFKKNGREFVFSGSEKCFFPGSKKKWRKVSLFNNI